MDNKLNKHRDNAVNILVKKLIDVENKIPEHERIDYTVSKSSVGWHIEHILLSISLIITDLENSNPNHYRWQFNYRRLGVFTIGKIPRGKAKSPDVGLPKKYDEDSLRNHVQKAKTKIAELKKMDPQQHFHHPYFGTLNRKGSIRFLEIHTNHHLEIINDILTS